jgi:hypothetical protein
VDTRIAISFLILYGFIPERVSPNLLRIALLLLRLLARGIFEGWSVHYVGAFVAEDFHRKSH